MKMENRNFSLMDAKQTLESKHPDLCVRSGVDYDKHYVFNTEPKQHNERKDGRWLNGLLAVDKKTHSIIGFNPFCFDMDAYFKAVKENIVNFDNDSEKSDQYRFSDKGAAYINQLLDNKAR